METIPVDVPTLSPKQAEVLGHLLAGESVSAAARATGIHRSTIYIWRQQDAFRMHFRQACVNRALAISDQIQQLTDLAIRNIIEVLSNTDHSPTVRLRAAKLVLDNALQPLAAEFRHNSTEFDTSEVFVPVESGQPAEPAVQTPDPAPEPQPQPGKPPEPAAAPSPETPANPTIDHAANLAAIDNVIDSVLARFLDESPLPHFPSGGPLAR